jgi:hypothetical protein
MTEEQLLDFLVDFETRYQGKEFRLSKKTYQSSFHHIELSGSEYAIMHIEHLRVFKQSSIVGALRTGPASTAIDKFRHEFLDKFGIEANVALATMLMDTNVIFTINELQNRIFELRNPDYYRNFRFPLELPIVSVSLTTTLFGMMYEYAKKNTGKHNELNFSYMYDLFNSMPLVAVPYEDYMLFVNGGVL